MASIVDENTTHRKVEDESSPDDGSADDPFLLGKSSETSVHYSEASLSAITHACKDHDREELPIPFDDAPSATDVFQTSNSDEIPRNGVLDESSISSTLVTNSSVSPSFAINSESNFNSICKTNSKQAEKPNLDLLPVRDSSLSISGGSIYSRSSKRSIRRRDVIKPVVLPTHTPATAQNKEVLADQLVLSAHAPKSQQSLPSNPQAGCADLVSCPTNTSTNHSVSNNHLALIVHETQSKGMEPPETARGNGSDPPGEERTDRDIVSEPFNGRKYRSVQWVDPKHVADDSEIDHELLNRYRELSSDYCPYERHSSEELMGQRRIRIATISSGYKTANFFVREDLDQRIYFHELEDALSYMARRGYARMERGQEKEWMALLKKAHEIVKVGPNKRKQRYRKGKLVLIMYKTINNHLEEYSDEKKSSQLTIASDADTAHTSLGRSIRCGYKSYSEKFLAEQEAAQSNGLLMLTNGPVDAPSYHSSNASNCAGLLQLTNGISTMSVVKEESHCSASNKRGVYGGGVRYFTPENSYSEDSDQESEESEESDEDKDKLVSDDFIEVEGSDMGSMFSEEEESCYPNDGVDSVMSSIVNSEMSPIARN